MAEPEGEDGEVLDIFCLYYRFISVAETDADITYTGFVTYLDLARDELSRELGKRSIPEDGLTEVEERVALCHLIADAYEMGNPDWSFRSQSQAPGVNFSRGDDTGPKLALNKLLDNIENSVKRSGYNGGRRITLTQIKDSTNYPKRFKRTDIPAMDIGESGFDSEAISDFGESIYDQDSY